ncbi:MAG: hypothetical protein LEGION0398_MBIBDBAK_01301 [Legionellaceae bacterium]
MSQKGPQKWRHYRINAAIDFSAKFYNFLNDIKERYNNILSIDNCIETLKEEKIAAEIIIKSLRELYTDWLYYKSHELKLLRIFSWIPIVKSLLIDKIKFFTSKNYLFFRETISCIQTIDSIFDENIKNQLSILNNIENEISQYQFVRDRYDQFIQQKKELENQLKFQMDIDNLYDFSNFENLLCKIDTTLRYELFLLATHYWEAAWLLESESIDTLSYDFLGRKQYWQLQAMLTPCFVKTLHMGPAYFKYKTSSQEFETLSDFIDLLIIDEAGQVMPALAGAMVSIAKKALLVGDTKQIEPVFSLTEGIDLANTKKFGLCSNFDDYEYLKKSGILCSGDNMTGHAYGNVVIVGQRQAKYHLQKEKEPGIYLKEHRRCAKEIISYCNELCYEDQLIPMAEEKLCSYPRMGYAHIKGCEEKNGSSRFNTFEANAIAMWIAKNKNKILETFGTDELSKCLGIVTPFTAQGNVIRNELQKYGLNITDVGTIHTLQGAEKDIIIFSPVYTSLDQKSGVYFFDKSPNMLNVAVSRAKSSFLVFGDIDNFDPNKGNLPSSLLAKYLFAHENNEITDVIQPKYVNKEDIQQINSLDLHRYILKKSFMRAEYELNIVSPFLSISAIKSDSIPDLIKKHSIRIPINIYSDPTLNKKNHIEFKQAQEILKDSGANVYLVNNVHSKIITIDDCEIIEGSFNWLSASRFNERYIREESSVIYSGKHVSRFIDEAMKPIKNKIK